MSRRAILGAIFVVLLASRLAHLRIVWVEEAYPAAAAIQILDSGKTLFRDIWFDKPGGSAYLYLLWGGRTGLPLRLADTLFIFFCCFVIFRFGLSLWGEREGLLAAVFLAFYLTFGIPAAVMALAPDLIQVLPHIACVYLAFRRQPLAAGLAAGVAFWINTKAVFVAASALLFLATPDWVRFFTGLVLAVGAQLGWLLWQGSLSDYWDQVWRWGSIYARDTFIANPLAYGLRQTLNWCGFQASLVLGAVAYFRAEGRRQFAGWLLLSLIPVALGLRFFPRYYFQLLPVCVLLAARGFMIGSRTWRVAMMLALAIPLVRFGPRYATLATDLITGRPHQWTDLALADDSRRVSQLLSQRAPQGATLFVWGYRPDIYALTRMKAATRFLDSQPLSGVIADRHLTSDHVSAPEWAKRFQNAVIESKPDYIVDGLGLLNPRLAIPRSWLDSSYTKIADTGDSLVYQRIQ